MAQSRRSVLQNIGALSAVQTLGPLHKIFALQSTPSKTASDSVLVLFEGPWLLSDVKSGPHKGQLMALSVSDTHTCQMGLWNITANSSNPPLKSPVDPELEAALLGENAVFHATRTPAKQNACRGVFDTAFNEPNPDAPPTNSFVFIRDRELEPKKVPGDRVIYLPVPDAMYVAGQLPYWNVTETGKVPLVVKSEIARMYISVILEYKATKEHPTTLSFSDESGTHFEVSSTHQRKQLIFRLSPRQTTMGNDSMHVQQAFADLVKRLLPNAPDSISVKPGALKVVVGPNPLGLTVEQLGIDPKDVIPNVPPPNPGGLRPQSMDFPSCTGGGLLNCD